MPDTLPRRGCVFAQTCPAHRSSAAVLALLFVLFVFSNRTATAQASPAAPTDPGQQIGPPFEVATIRPANTNDGRTWYGIQITNSGRLMTSALSLESLVYWAYQPDGERDRVEGGPAWASSAHWDINAKIDDSQLTGWGALSNAERNLRVQPMLRQLLVERFHLKLHPEMRLTSVYAMVQVKAGAKLKPVDPPAELRSFADEAPGDRNAVPDRARPGTTMMTGNEWMGTAIKPSQLTGQIGYSSHLDAMVIDETGLTGYYDFNMTIDYDKDAPPFQDQVEQQLGLKLIPKKVPMKTWVIDAAEKPSLDGA